MTIAKNLSIPLLTALILALLAAAWPAARRAEAHARGGLQATYFDAANLSGKSVSRVDDKVQFSWGTASPAAGIAPDTFSVRWTGRVEVPRSGAYTF